MRTIVVTILALVAGFFAGLLLSEVIGISGFLLFQRAIGIKYLPVYLALACAGVALVADLAAQRRSR